jgi:hypothetical protein
MSNLLVIPFKRSSAIDIRDPVRNYIQNNTGTHPDEFKLDIARWLALRKDALGTAIHVNAVDPILLSVPSCFHSFPLIDPFKQIPRTALIHTFKDPDRRTSA